jgi:beta-N-acetylhexosaminidase
MVAMTASLPRREMLPTAIETGCDLFLFFNDPEEDFQWMKEGLENGLLTEERLHDAIRRTLGLKAKIGLHNTPCEEIMLPKEEALSRIATEDNTKVVREVADKAITLVKDKKRTIPNNTRTLQTYLISTSIRY